MTLGWHTVKALTISETRQQQADRDCCSVPKSPCGVLEAKFPLNNADRDSSRNDRQ